VKETTKTVKSEDANDGGGIFSIISGSSIPKKSKTNASASTATTVPKTSLRAEVKKPGRSVQTMDVPVTDKRLKPQNGSAIKQEDFKKQSNAPSTPVKRKADEMSDETPTKRPRLSPPGPKKKRVTWSDKLEHVKVFEKEVPIDDTEEQQLQQQQGYNQDHLSEKLFFTQQREERRRRLEQMNASTSWYQPSPLANVAYLITRGQESQELSIRRAENMKKPAVVYHRKQDIPPTPTSPISSTVIDPNLLSTLCSVLNATSTGGNSNPYGSPPISVPMMSQQQQPQYAPPANPYVSYNNAPPQVMHGIATSPINRPINPMQVVAPPLSSQQQQFKASKGIRCRFFGTKVGCRNGSSCPFYHHGIDPMPPGGVKEFDPEIAKQVQEARAQKHGDKQLMPQPISRVPQPMQIPTSNGVNPYASSQPLNNNNNNSGYRGNYR
jgi:hypothetical protein